MTENTENTVERVAQAIGEISWEMGIERSLIGGVKGFDWHRDMSEAHRRHCRRMARAAIAALRTPDDSIKEVCVRHWEEDFRMYGQKPLNPYYVIEVGFAKAIDAILADGPS